MQVTRVKVRLSGEDVVKACVDIVLDDCIVVHGLRLIRHSTGYLLALPTKKHRNGKAYDVAFPTTNEARRMIEEAVMAEYHKLTGQTVSLSQGLI